MKCCEKNLQICEYTGQCMTHLNRKCAKFNITATSSLSPNHTGRVQLYSHLAHVPAAQHLQERKIVFLALFSIIRHDSTWPMP